MEEVRHYTEHFARFEQATASDAPRLGQLRREALAHFARKGFPTFEDEEWRRTPLAPLAEARFEPADGRQSVAPERVKPFRLEGSAAELVLVNGRYSPELSRTSLPEGMAAGSLAGLLEEQPVLAGQHLARHARWKESSFVALNTAFLREGAFVRVPRETVVEAPIHVLHLSLGSAKPSVSHPRTLLVVEEEAQASFVESYAALGEGTYFTNAVSELVMGERAVVEHHKLQLENKSAFHLATLQIEQGRESALTSVSLALGGLLARTDINTELSAGAECTLNGLFVAGGEQLTDHHTRIDHAEPHGQSRELYKGILDGRARGVFDGKIIVRKDAQKTDARQINKNLLLSTEASIDTTPRLDILADDVKCSHGSTIGQLQEEALFYLRSRGIGLEDARRLLVRAFASDILNGIRLPQLRERVEGLLALRLPGMRAAEVIA